LVRFIGINAKVNTHIKKAGQVRYRTDKAAIIHAGIGKASFTADAFAENITALMEALKKAYMHH
jgi:ribosomal protein L1